jgi:phage-related minor tail protein
VAKPIVVQIIGDAKQFTSTLSDAGSKLESFSAQFATPGGAALAFGSAILGAGVALFKMGQSAQEAFDQIRVSTGATGDALQGMEDSVNRIAQTTPSAFGQIADAVTELNQRLDLTGLPLEGLATQFLNLSRITGTDLHQNITAVTGAFNNWGIAQEDQKAKLDELFRAYQQTGVAVADLATTLAQNGAVLRDAGYGFESATAFIAEMGRRGVDATQVLSGLRHAEAAVTEEHVKAQKDQAKASQDAADRVVAATERRRAAEERLAQITKDNARAAEDAAKALADANTNQAEVEADAAKDVARAKEDAAKLIEHVQKPVNDGAVAMADYNKRLAEAQQEAAQKVADAEDTAAKRRRDAAKRVVDDQERVTRVTEDSADRVAQAHQQTADANERANARVRSSSTETTAALSKDNESTATSIQGVIAKIQELGPSAEAQSLALQAFGARAGEQMYAALTQGKTGVQDLENAIKNGSDTVNKAAADADRFGQSWQRLKNDLTVAIEPAATDFFVGLSVILEKLIEDVPKLGKAIKDASGWLGNSLGGFVQSMGHPGFATGGQVMASGFYPVGERGRENVWLPQGAQVQPSWSGGGGGGDTYNIHGYTMSPAELAREIAWQRRRGDGR